MNTGEVFPARRLLIIDDESDFVAGLADILADFGYQVDSATSARQALSLISKHRYDAAVMDYRMPELNGIELHQKLRQVQGDLATILLTAYADGATHQAALDAGFWHVLEKPLDVPEIAQMLDRLTQRPLLLIVDDEPDFCDSLHQVLHQHKIRAAYCQSVNEGLGLLRKQRFDVVLLDVKFPDESPTELVRFVLRQAKPATILVMTGKAQGEDPDLANLLQLGLKRVHQKPLDIRRLIQEVAELDGPQESRYGRENDLN